MCSSLAADLLLVLVIPSRPRPLQKKKKQPQIFYNSRSDICIFDYFNICCIAFCLSVGVGNFFFGRIVGWLKRVMQIKKADRGLWGRAGGGG